MRLLAPFNSSVKVINLFKKLGTEKKYQMSFFIVSMCTILCLYVGIGYVIKQETAKKFLLEENKYIVKYVEDVQLEEGQLVVKGWSFYKGSDSDNNFAEIILRNVNDEEDVVVLDTVMEMRTDVNEYFGGNENYTNSGFVAKGKDKRIQTDLKSYEILIRLQYFVSGSEYSGEKVKQERTVSTKRYIVNGKLAAMLPEEDFEPIRTKSVMLNEVFDNGKLLAYRKDADMHVYQYGKDLYWVAGEHFAFEEDGSTYIGLQVETTKPECLPTGWKKGDWTGEYLNFYFEEHEITVDEMLPYRIAVRALPSEYPVTQVGTGCLANSEWIWREFGNIDISSLQ